VLTVESTFGGTRWKNAGEKAEGLCDWRQYRREPLKALCFISVEKKQEELAYRLWLKVEEGPAERLGGRSSL